MLIQVTDYISKECFCFISDNLTLSRKVVEILTRFLVLLYLQITNIINGIYFILFFLFFPDT